MKKLLRHSKIGLMLSKLSVGITIIAIVFTGQLLLAQNVSINTDGSPPDSSAILDVSADNKGILIPRVDLSGVNDTTTIKSPHISLFIYNTATTADLTPGYYYWDGNAWSRLSTVWKQDSSDIYYDRGNVGIGTQAPDYLLEVIGNSGVEYKPIAYFENTLDSIDGEPVHGFGVMGIADTTDGYGFGVYGRGGFIGVRGRVHAQDTFGYYGVAGTVTGGSGQNYGVWGAAYCDSTDGTNIGIAGRANGPGRNVGLEANASGGHTNFAIYGSAHDTSSSQSYAGYFEGDVHISDRVGIGVHRPIEYKLAVIGESGAAQQPIAYFENTLDSIDGQLVDAYGVMGVCNNADWAGYGGLFKGGYVGVRGEVFPTDTFSYFGARGIAIGGSGTNFGTHGYADGDGTNVGVRGRANGTDVNYGLWGYAKSGLTNYAVYGIVDTTGVLGTYAGYFQGDVSVFGRLGVGTGEPAVPAHLYTNEGEGILRLQSSFSGSDERGIIQWYTEQNTDTWAAKIGPSTHPDDLGLVIATNSPGDFNNQKNIVFKTSNNERMRINSSGRVGIGTANPGARLEVDGETWLNSETYIDDNLTIGRTSFDNHIQFRGSMGNSILKMFSGDFWLQTDSGVKTSIASGDDFKIQTYDAGYKDRLFIKTTGEIGFGNTDPHGDFQINEHLVFQRTSSGLDYQMANNLYYESGWKYIASDLGSVISLGDNGDFAFGNAPTGTAGGSATITNRFYIRNNGNVGIGTTTPNSRLVVEGDLTVGHSIADRQIYLNGTVGDGIIKMYPGGDFALSSDDGVKMRIASGDDFKIETLAGASLVSRVYVANNGNVGIGTLSPASILDVEGTLNTDGLKMATGASSGHVLTSDGSGNASWQAPPSGGLVPVGAILPWAKSISGVPALPTGFVECNGQTLSDAGSPLNGQSIPALNGRFLRGASTSGAMGGTDNHSHTGTTSPSSDPPVYAVDDQPSMPAARVDHAHSLTTNSSSHLPSYYEVVWIMRVK